MKDILKALAQLARAVATYIENHTGSPEAAAVPEAEQAAPVAPAEPPKRKGRPLGSKNAPAEPTPPVEQQPEVIVYKQGEAVEVTTPAESTEETKQWDVESIKAEFCDYIKKGPEYSVKVKAVIGQYAPVLSQVNASDYQKLGDEIAELVKNDK
jgi:hypothetical protein